MNKPESIYLIDEFVTVTPGKPFRLFPFGQLVKNGKVREITRALAEKFKLPHFKPPIKLGSHADETAAGGFITGLEVRDDGLYAQVELNDEGQTALDKGAYRYHSPEVIWEGWLENPSTGSKIEGPLIVGDALLHTPHLGEAAALYSVDVIEGDEIMTTNQDMVSVSTLERLKEWFTGGNELVVELEPVQQPEPQENFQAEYEEAQTQVENLTAQIAEFEQAQVRQERVAQFASEFNEVEAVDDQELYGILADIPEEAANALVTKIKAIAEQARVSNLTTDLGNAGGDVTGDPTAVLDAAVQKVMVDQNVNYPKALDIVRVDQPEVFNAYVGGSK